MNEEKFFDELRKNVVNQKKVEWIKELYEEAKKKDFEIRWGAVKHFTMRFFVKR